MGGQAGDISQLVEKLNRLEGELREVALRLEKLERSHRWLRRAGAVVLLGLVLVCAGGAALIGDQVTRLDVIGPNVDVRASLNVDPVTGSAGLEIFGLNGRRVIFLGTSQNGIPNLSIYDPTGMRIVREVAP